MIRIPIRCLRINSWFLALLFGVGLLLTNPALAQVQRQEHAITLRAIMQDLRVEYLRATNALLADDFKVLVEAANAIQGHPLPDGLVTAIKRELGKEFRAFEAVDERSHQAAADLAKRAAARDLSGSAKAYGRLADGCVSCHKQFRAKLRALSN